MFTRMLFLCLPTQSNTPRLKYLPSSRIHAFSGAHHWSMWMLAVTYANHWFVYHCASATACILESQSNFFYSAFNARRCTGTVIYKPMVGISDCKHPQSLYSKVLISHKDNGWHAAIVAYMPHTMHTISQIHSDFPSMLWHGWWGDRKGIRPVKSWVFWFVGGDDLTGHVL